MSVKKSKPKSKTQSIKLNRPSNEKVKKVTKKVINRYRNTLSNLAKR